MTLLMHLYRQNGNKTTRYAPTVVINIISYINIAKSDAKVIYKLSKTSYTHKQ